MRSFLQGKKALATEPLRPLVQPGALRAQGGGLHLPQFSTLVPAESGVSVEVVKEGDKVVRLVVTCACGERVEVECLYSAGR